MLSRLRHFGSPLGRTATSALQLEMPCPPALAAPPSGRGGAAGGAAAGIQAAKRSAVGIVGWQQGAAALPDAHGNAWIVRRQDWRGLPARLGGRKGTIAAGVHLGRPGFQGYQFKECVY